MINNSDIINKKYDDDDDDDIKYKKYKNQYKPNSIYWGLGIENEVYLEFDNSYYIPKNNLLTHRKRERYSVNYYTNYQSNILNEALEHFINQIDSSNISIPILLNAHSFTKTDIYNQPETLYTTVKKLNTQFSGNTLIQTLQKNNPYFINSIDNQWLFDGDTIEFNTLRFFNSTLNDIISELDNNKTEFIKELNYSFDKLNIFSKYGNVRIMGKNHPFTSFLTNYNNISMFNNGTLHYNITLPSELDLNGKIKNHEVFIDDHSKAIKIIQWMEPFIIAMYGSGDPFSLMNDYKNKNKFSMISQRCAISRYIGIGTYDTDEMLSGKILTIPISDIVCNQMDNWWFHEFYKNNAYTKLEEIGVDINFNKHYNHGIELRFLDHISDNSLLMESFEFIIYLMDMVLENDRINTFGNPILNDIWNNIVFKIMVEGREYTLTRDEIELYEQIFNMTFDLEKTKVFEIYNEIYNGLVGRFNKLYKSPNDAFTTLYPIGKFSVLTLSPHKKILDTNEPLPNEVTNIKIADVQKTKITAIDSNYTNCCNIM